MGCCGSGQITVDLNIAMYTQNLSWQKLMVDYCFPNSELSCCCVLFSPFTSLALFCRDPMATLRQVPGRLNFSKSMAGGPQSIWASSPGCTITLGDLFASLPRFPPCNRRAARLPSHLLGPVL